MNYLRRVRGYYYFRVRVPVDLVNVLHHKEMKVSLKTTSLKNAKVLAKSYSYKLEKLYTYARCGMLTGEQIQRIVSDFLHSALRNFEEGRASGIVVQNEDTLAKMVKAYEHMGIEDTESLKFNRLEDIQGWLDDTLEEQAVTVDKERLDYKMLCREALKARIELWKIESERLRGNYKNDYDRA